MRVAWIEMRWRQSLARNRGLLEWEGGEPSFRADRNRRMSAPTMTLGARGGGAGSSEMDLRGGGGADRNGKTLSPRSAGKQPKAATAASSSASAAQGAAAKRGRRASVGGVPANANRGGRAKPAAQHAGGDGSVGRDDAAANGGDAVDAADVGLSLPPAEASKI